jgi:hypothetical protein
MSLEKVGSHESRVSEALEAGEQRKDALKKNIQQGKQKLSDWFNKAKSFFGNKAEKAGTVILATPELVKMGAEMTTEAAGRTADAIDKKVQQAEVWIDTKAADVKNFAATKVEQATAFTKETALIGAGIALMGAQMATEKTAQVKEALKQGVADTKEKISSSWGNIVEYGRRAIASAEMKRQALVDAAREKANAIKLEKLESELSARESMMEQNARAVIDLKQKIAMMQDLSGNVMQAAA